MEWRKLYSFKFADGIVHNPKMKSYFIFPSILIVSAGLVYYFLPKNLDSRHDSANSKVMITRIVESDTQLTGDVSFSSYIYDPPIKLIGTKVVSTLPQHLSPAFDTYIKSLQPVNLDFDSFNGLATSNYMNERQIETRDKYEQEIEELKKLRSERGLSPEIKRSVVWSLHVSGSFGEFCWMVGKPLAHIDKLPSEGDEEKQLSYTLLTFSKGVWMLESLDRLESLGLILNDYKYRGKLLKLEQALEVKLKDRSILIIR